MYKRILVTRPEPKGTELTTLLKAAGFEAFNYPLIKMEPLEPSFILEAIAKIHAADAVIFVSPNAVHYAWEALDESLRDKLRAMRLFAVGKSTANALLERQCQSVCYPKSSAGSEALLTLPELTALTGKKVWIMRGAKGRELIFETLTQNGNQVAYITCFTSALPHGSENLIDIWQKKPFDLVILTSSESLKNLIDLLGAERYLLDQSVITVMSPRMQTFAKGEGIQKCLMLPSANNKDILAWLKNLPLSGI